MVAQQSPTQAAGFAVARNRAADPPGLIAQQSPAQAHRRGNLDRVSSTPQLAARQSSGRTTRSRRRSDRKPARQLALGIAPAEKSESALPDLPNRTESAAKDSLPTTASGEQSPSSSEHVATARKRNDSSASKTKARRQRVAKSSAARSAPPFVWVAPARFLGTTPAGNWVLRLPSGETVITPPLPNVDDAPVISHRRVRRVARPIPLEDEPPVVVLPPGF